MINYPNNPQFLYKLQDFSTNKSLKLKLGYKEVYVDNEKILCRQSYKRRKILEIFLTNALHDRLVGNECPTLISSKDFVNLLGLPPEEDIEGHLMKPIRFLSRKLQGAIVTSKKGRTKHFHLNLNKTLIEIY